ncbi:MAG: aminotransferase class I/II-fold pyridoxal phosphate-dependent enzyme, partial [Candidatus Ranarchaeia archaeon]
EYCERLATTVFKAKISDVRPLSGHVSVLAALLALTSPQDEFLMIGDDNGGYPLEAQPFQRKKTTIPFVDQTTIDLAATLQMIREKHPPLVFLGCSFMPFPQPVKPVAEAVHEYDGILVYDASHPLGLIAGGEFQDPLREGADVMIGSTHKTLPGPQGGICVGNHEEAMQKIRKTLGFPCVLVDNNHLHRIAALAATLEEIQEHGKEYAQQIVRNTKSLSTQLFEYGFPLYGEDRGFSQSHVSWWPVDSVESGMAIKDQLQMNNVIVDVGVRFGSQELTRRGMKEKEMLQVATYVSRAHELEEPDMRLQKEIQQFVSTFDSAHYC